MYLCFQWYAKQVKPGDKHKPKTSSPVCVCVSVYIVAGGEVEEEYAILMTCAWLICLTHHNRLWECSLQGWQSVYIYLTKVLARRRFVT